MFVVNLAKSYCRNIVPSLTVKQLSYLHGLVQNGHLINSRDHHYKPVWYVPDQG